jgi:hypothetical protein
MKSLIRRNKLAENFNAGVGSGKTRRLARENSRPGVRAATREQVAKWGQPPGGQNEQMQRARRVLRS